MSAPSKILTTLKGLVTQASSWGDYALAAMTRAIIKPRGNGILCYVNNAGDLVDTNGNGVLRGSRTLAENFETLDTTDQVAVMLATGAAASGATGVLHHVYTPGGNVLAAFALGAGQTLLPTVVAGGLDIGGDQVATEGWELASHGFGATGRPFVIGNTPAFYMRIGVKIDDVSGIAHLLAGFRRLEAVNATYTSYADYAAIGAIAGDVYLKTGNDGTDVSTDTTNDWADGETHTLGIYVDAVGNVTYKLDGAAPTTVAAFAFDNGDPVVPFIRFLHDTDLAGGVTITFVEVGLQ